ncbi:hypothetical protein ACFE04_024614 [Oxalis oulophora]
MEINSSCVQDDRLELPPGFRFHPTDEELISHYLYKKVIDVNFSSTAIGDVDLNKSEPWELPWKAKMGEKEWYFFCLRDRKYPTGLRTNRATESGYWKATGKDKEIYRAKSLVGMKKTLVFYKGRAPKGEKTNWVMHEYRLEGKFSVHNLPKTAKSEWVICRVFQKSSGGKKTHISGLVSISSFGNELGGSGLPQLMDSSSSQKTEADHVPCFSNPIDTKPDQEINLEYFNNPYSTVSLNPTNAYSQIPISNAFCLPNSTNFQFSSSAQLPVPDQLILRGLLGNNGSGLRSFKIEKDRISPSQETGLSTDVNNETSSNLSNLEVGNRPFDQQQAPSTSVEPVDLDCFWNY